MVFYIKYSRGLIHIAYLTWWNKAWVVLNVRPLFVSIVLLTQLLGMLLTPVLLV